MGEGCEISSTRFIRAEDRRTEIVEATQGRFSNIVKSRFDLATVDKASRHLQLTVIYVLENTSLRAM